jgi:hypothetical protein
MVEAILWVCVMAVAAGVAAYHVASARQALRLASSHREWRALEEELEGEP